MKIAYFSPLYPQRSGIATYSETLLPFLADHAEIDLYTEGTSDGRHADVALAREGRPVCDVGEFPCRVAAAGYDICLYQIGNSVEYHAATYHTLLRHPGVTVLHDVNLHDMVAGLTAGRGDPSTYVREMGYAYGVQGLYLGRQARLGRHLFDPADYPLMERVVDASLGVIVHSNYARSMVLRERPYARVAVIPQVQRPAAEIDRAAARARLEVPPDTFVVASFGYIAPSKRTRPALGAFRRFRDVCPQAHYILVGQPVDEAGLLADIDELGLGAAVTCTGYLEPDRYRSYLAATDVALNLRYPTRGETSSTLLELAAAGRPAIVTDVDAFHELPEDVCVKIALGPGEEDRLLAAMTALVGNEGLRAEIGAAAQDWVRRTADPASVARSYVAFLREVLAGV